MRSRTLHSALVAFAEDAASTLAAERADGAELPYDVVQAGRSSRGGTPLYCYRPMTGEFILARFEHLRGLETYVPALRALASLDGLGHYLRAHGRRGIPVDRRSCAELALFVFLSELFEDATEFEVSPERLRRTYGALESTLFADVSHTTFAALVRGVEIVSPELLLGGGLALVRPEALDDGPPDPLPAAGPDDEPSAMVTLSVQATPGESGALEEARVVLAGLVEALNLFGDACVAIDPAGWMRVDDGPWQVAVLGRPAPAHGVLQVAPLQEDELRAFCSLVARRAPRGGELAWALSRFRMGCEREHRWEGLTDHLLALRALLELEGPASGRLPGRLAALCAMPEDRPALAERVVDVLAMERAVMAGLEPADRDAETLADEVTGHLRALLRDVICGHLDADLQGLADRLIADAAAEPGEPERDEPEPEAAESEVVDPEAAEAVAAEAEEDEPEEDEPEEDEPVEDEAEEATDWDDAGTVAVDAVLDEDELVDEDETLDERGAEPEPDQLWSGDEEPVDEPAVPEDAVDDPGPGESTGESESEPVAPRAKPRRARKATATSRTRRAPTRVRP